MHVAIVTEKGAVFFTGDNSIGAFGTGNEPYGQFSGMSRLPERRVPASWAEHSDVCETVPFASSSSTVLLAIRRQSRE
jgi:hypothetical protein